ncbi:MAG: sulfatase-like hydrolase/transferase [SAR324 cluster bacterium]|uniref:Sulfatase-like hydrolase/transferase n=1 Tax=SAR324 cluster bacterium TaxID=2024889 RepID=A0A7X9IIT1_9DELT|nr:sulfatase-like hydrolase/transferase [SAR324 cluster bacterium]
MPRPKEGRESNKSVRESHFSWEALVISTVASVFFYVLMEWLFQITKPSFLSIVPFASRVLTYLLTSSSLSVMFTVPLVLSLLILKITPKHYQQRFCWILLLISAGILASCVLLLIDNFTYTIFKFGIFTSRKYLKIIYELAFIIFILLFWGRVLKFQNFMDKNALKYISKYSWAIWFLLSIFIAIPSVFIVGHNITKKSNILSHLEINSKNPPNIIIFTADSVDANHMSLYGYERDTTPFLKKLSSDSNSWVALNAFSNAQGTTGAITSILTGRDPTKTRVIYAPDILRGEDSYLHLPGILRENGYYNVQLTYNFYSDALALNFLGAFDEVNGKGQTINRLNSFINDVLPTNEAFFIQELGNRLISRLKHIFFNEDMQSAFAQVIQPTKPFNDYEKLEYLLSLIDKSEQPLFVHLHWMGTHGPAFLPKRQVFSIGQDLQSQSRDDLNIYDDTILELDQAISKLFKELAKRRKLNNTLIVFTSDHSRAWNKTRLPLLIRFPSPAKIRIANENAQHLDIAPTILDYLNIPIPSWMDGQPLSAQQNEGRPIYVSTVGQTAIDEKLGFVIHTSPPAPFYQFGNFSMITCNKWYEIDLTSGITSTGLIDNYQGIRCKTHLTEDGALKMMINQLKISRFDPSSLEHLSFKPI